MKELIQLAKDVGFESRVHGMSYACGTQECYCEWREEQEPNLIDYLWLCELQQWLRNERGIDVVVILDNSIKRIYKVNIYRLYNPFSPAIFDDFDSYDQALHEGLAKAIKLTKD